MTNQQQIEKHTIVQSIILHLFPGILVGVFYFLIRQPVQNFGYPSSFALILAIIFLVPVELGYLLLKGKQATGRYTLDGLISYRTPIPWWQSILGILIVLVLMAAIFTVLKPVDNILIEKLFFWMPTLDSGLDGSYSKTALIVTYSIFSIFGVIVVPTVEELYFRGYLLPRIPVKYSELFHSFLFAAYHVWTPWMFITRTIAMLPLIIAVKKKNIYIGIVAHILLNSVDVIVGFAFIFSLA
ncbi:MAG: CPBP family intramembrane metalloprotease [Anaerolineales bacterium]|nr:CPBP family intramembrane metalloprotease [Anaerolineales bacterium]